MNSSISKPSAPKPRVLLVDDDRLVSRLMEIAFRNSGFETYTANNGEQACEIIESNPVQLVVLDMMMPVMDGMRFLGWIRQDNKYDIPVLVVTAMARGGNEERIRSAGANDVLFKPVEMNTLIERARHLLDS